MFATKSSTLFVLLILVIAHLGLTSAQSTISWGEPFTVDYTTGTAVNTPSTAPEPSLLSPSPSKPLSTQTSSSVGRSPSPSIPASSSPISSSEPPRSSISVLVTDSSPSPTPAGADSATSSSTGLAARPQATLLGSLGLGVVVAVGMAI